MHDLRTTTLIRACNSNKTSEIVQWPYGVKYEIFVMSFADGDGNGKGDFKGLTAKLDYLQGSRDQWYLAYADHAIGYLS